MSFMDTRAALVSAIFIGVVGPEVFIVQPGFVQGLVQLLGYSDQTAGYVASAEMFGIATTSVLLTFSSHRINWRTAVIASLLLMAAANFACTFVSDVIAFSVFRFVAGLGAGVLVSLSFAAIGLSSNPDRNFGYLIMWVLTYGAFGLLLMPTAYELGGMNGVLIFFAIFPLVALLFVRNFPTSGEQPEHVESDAVTLSSANRYFALFAMLTYFLAQGVVWAYLFLIGLDGGLSEQEVANGLTISQFAGIAGALLAALIGAQWGRTLPLLLGILGGAACLYFFVGTFAFLVFAVVVTLYNFAWNWTHPYLLAAMASFDRTGRVVVYAVAMQMLGLAFGPFLAATVVGTGNYVNVLALGGGLFVLSAAFILPPVIAHSRVSRGL